MKKTILFFIAIVLLICASGYSWYISNYEGINYYAYISENRKPDKEKEIYNQEMKSFQYTYVLKGVGDKGKFQELKLTTFEILKTNTYLEVFANKKNEVISWVERDKNEIPKKELKQLKHTA